MNTLKEPPIKIVIDLDRCEGIVIRENGEEITFREYIRKLVEEAKGGGRMEKLKRCPFCGGEVVLSYSSKGTFNFQHRKYGGCMFFEFVCYIAPNGVGCLADAAEAWNRRVKDE